MGVCRQAVAASHALPSSAAENVEKWCDFCASFMWRKSYRHSGLV